MKKLIVICLSFFTTESFCQNVGIGTVTPTKGKLEIVGVAGAGNTNAIFGSNVTGISLQQNWPTIGFNQYRDNTAGNGRFMGDGYAAIQFMDPNGGGMYFDMLSLGYANTLTTSGTRALALMYNGNVGIHCDGSTATLTVSRGTGGEGTARFDGTNNVSYFNFGTNEDTYIRSGKEGKNVFINDINNGIVSMGNYNGNTKVGINTNNPGEYSLFVKQVVYNGENRGILIQDRNTFNEWELRNVGYDFNFVFNANPRSGINGATGNYYIISDRRLKTNLREMPDVLNKVMQLQPLEYDMTFGKPGDEKNNGFIAQDVKKLFPNLVKIFPSSKQSPVYGDITDLHMMDYSGFGVIAIKAIQEQQKEIEDLRKEVKELKELIKK